MLYFYYPKNLVIDGKTIFSNIRFIENKILFVGAVYLSNPIDYSQVKFKVNEKSYFPKIIERRQYEPSIVCILEDSTWQCLESLSLEIEFECNHYSFILQKEKYSNYNLSASTLFKDDYELLDFYIDYYIKHGVECFFLYYNGSIKEEIFEFLKSKNVPIYITEWNYPYWLPNPRQLYPDHHAQVMSICDGLNLCKFTSKYCLFNDLDEYIFLDKKLSELVTENPNVTNFYFECYWTSVGKDIIKFKELKNKFAHDNLLINSKSCGNSHMKSFIKCNSIDIMRIHFPVSGNIISHFGSGFFHICNLENSDRRLFMESNLIQSESNRLSPSDILESYFLKNLTPNNKFKRYICTGNNNIHFIKNFIQEEILSRDNTKIDGFIYNGIHCTFKEYHSFIKCNQ